MLSALHFKRLRRVSWEAVEDMISREPRGDADVGLRNRDVSVRVVCGV